MSGARGSHHIFERIHVAVPQFPFFEIPFVEFPAFFRIAHAFLQALLLFLLRDVEEKFENSRPIFREQFLKLLDLLEPTLHHIV
jgi:hypothetical protein